MNGYAMVDIFLNGYAMVGVYMKSQKIAKDKYVKPIQTNKLVER